MLKGISFFTQLVADLVIKHCIANNNQIYIKLPIIQSTSRLASSTLCLF